MADMEKFKRHFRHIWDCEVIHPIFSDKVCEIVEKTVEMVEQERRWIPVSERLPDGEYDVLLIGDGKGFRIAYYSCGTWYDYQHNHLKGFTHWMPLPKPPKEGDGDEQ